MQQTLSLPPVTEVSGPSPVALTSRQRLWLCIYLPLLPLEALCRRDDTVPRVVFDERQGIRRVLLANAKARTDGVVAGMSVNAALSLAPGLHLEERSKTREARLMKHLAVWAERFTSFVAIEPGGVLLLEIAGSLRLFEGVTSIRQRVANGLDEQGLTAMLAVAPTPLAGIWLARSGHDVCIDDLAHLAGSLGSLPIESLDWPDSVTGKLRGMGVTCIGDCLRLPRQGFARRFGARFLNEFDRALGRLPDPRESYRAPPRFCAEIELDEEQDDGELLLHACHELLAKLERFLRTRQLQIQRVRFSFFHLRTVATHLMLGCVQAGQGVEHWSDLLRIKFERLALPAPAIAIRLHGGQAQVSAMGTDRLQFDTSAQHNEAPIAHLVERLNARMGEDAVHGVATVAEHRPQYAWRPASLLGEAPRCATATGVWNEREVPELLGEIRRTNSLLLRRPLWILETPEPLAVRQDRPWYRGALTLLDGPERLESGWWDGEGIARDYFIARTDDGVHLWVFHNRRNGRTYRERDAWHLHGIFG